MSCENLDYQIEKTKDGLDILKITIDDKNIYIGSKYNMSRDIDKFLQGYTEVDEKKTVLLVYGFGAGEHIKALRKKFIYNKIVVFEPNQNMEDYIKNIKWIKEDENIIVTCTPSESVKNILKKDIVNEFNVELVRINYFANYNKIFSQNMSEIYQEIRRFLTSLKIESNTGHFENKTRFNNMLNNILYMVNGVPADIYKDKYKNKPAVIVSAGPSLEKNIDLLKNIDGNMIIIGGGRTLRPLIDKGISPDLLVVVDPQQICYDLCKDYIENLDKPLLFCENTNKEVVSNHKGQKLFFTYNEFVDKLCQHKIERIDTGGTVANTMAEYAVMLGCNPIIFIGQDLAYTDEKSHAHIAESREGELKFEQVKDDKYDIYVEGIDGNMVRTSLLFDKYRIFFEDMISQHNEITFINATEGGARIKGTIEMTLRDAINKYKCNKFSVFEQIDYRVDMKENLKKLLLITKKTCNEIINSYNEAIILLNHLKLSSKNNDKNKINNILSKLDNIDRKVNGKYKHIELVDSLVYPIIYEVMAAKSMDEKLTFNEKIERIYEENKKFYSSINEALRYALERIDNAMSEL